MWDFACCSFQSTVRSSIVITLEETYPGFVLDFLRIKSQIAVGKNFSNSSGGVIKPVFEVGPKWYLVVFFDLSVILVETKGAN